MDSKQLSHCDDAPGSHSRVWLSFPWRASLNDILMESLREQIYPTYAKCATVKSIKAAVSGLNSGFTKFIISRVVLSDNNFT